MNKNVNLVIGTVTLLLLLYFSVLFYKERAVFIDDSYFLFEMIRTRSWAITDRIVAVFTQFSPIIATRFGFSLQSIVLSYSISFQALYLGAFLFIILVLDNVRVAVAYFLFVILMTTHTFYWIVSELPQGVAFLFLLLALMDNILRQKRSYLYYTPVIAVLLVLVVFSHPLLLIAFLFMMFFVWLSYPTKTQFVCFVTLLYFLVYGIKQVFFSSGYDSQAMSGIGNFITYFPNYFTLTSNKNFLHYLLHDYYLFLILLIVVGVFYAVKKMFLKLLLVLCFSGGYILLTNVSSPAGPPQFYIENQYLLLAIFVGVPFVFDVFPTISSVKLQTTIIALIAVAGVLRIYNTSLFYTARLNWFRNILAKTEMLPNKKIIYTSATAPLDTLLMTWATPYEFWLLSTLEQNESRSIVYEERPDEFEGAINNNHIFIARWGVFEYDSLNKNYFKFNDTIQYVKE